MSPSTKPLAARHFFSRKGMLSEWHPSYVTHSPWRPVAFFERPPRNKDVVEFVSWRPHDLLFRTPADGFRTLASAVRLRAWFETIGERPPRLPP